MSDTIIQKLEAFQTGFETKFDKLQRQVDALDEKSQRIAFGGSKGDPAEMLAKSICEHADDYFRNGRARFEVKSPTLATKATVTSSGLTGTETSGRYGVYEGNVYGAVRGLFANIPLGEASIQQIRETAVSGWAASPQTEASEKAEQTANLTLSTLNARTIAAWIPATKQALADVEGLTNYLRSRLFWSLAKKIDAEIISGDGSGEHLSGITLTASAADVSQYGSVWDAYSILILAGAQLRQAGFMPDFVLVSPLDAAKMKNQRTTDRQFLIPPGGTIPRMVETPAITPGSFIMGDSSQGVVRLREEAIVDISESHADFWVRNQVAIRCEERLLFNVISPNAFVSGSLVGSPS